MRVTDFLPYVLPDVMGCPTPMARQAIVAAAIEFCRDTHVWSEIQDAVPLQDGVPDYEIDAPSGAQIEMVLEVWVGGIRLTPATPSVIGAPATDWTLGGSNQPRFYNAMLDRDAIRVFPTPANTHGETFVARTAFVPKVGATTLPDFLGRRHIEAIASGAKTRLMAMARKQWSSPELAVYHRELFNGAKSTARISVLHGGVPSTLRVKPRAFGF